ncbi:hypothetical protein [Streptomyces sp. ODS28]|uniref:hypothetical protein n=1 Tax=Streptomyces sp. ODS28 TaxID=3136688 RepID=UPI0031E99A78
MATPEIARRRSAGRIVLVGLCCFGILAAVLYGTGVYDRVRDSFSLDGACEGVLAQGELDGALGAGGRAKAEDRSGSGGLAGCHVQSTADGAEGRFDLDVRWVGGELDAGVDDEARFLLPDRTDTSTTEHPVAPLGHGWPGVSSQDEGMLRVSLTFPCARSQRNLLVSGLLVREDGEAAERARTGFARLVSSSGMRAADKYGCDTARGTRITKAPADPFALSASPRKVSSARGTCAALRPLAGRAAKVGAPMARESSGPPAFAGRAPAVDCFLSPKGEFTPAYRLSALYTPYAETLRREASDGWANLHSPAGRGRSDSHMAWGSAQCPGEKERALFLIHDVYDSSARDSGAPRPSRPFESAALRAFAKGAAEEHGCADLRLP